MNPLDVPEPSQLRRALRREVRTSEEARFLNRLQCVSLVAAGNSCRAVAEWTGENVRTIQLWVNRYNVHGAQGLRRRSTASRGRALDEHQLGAVRRDLELAPRALGLDEPRWTGPLLRRHLEQRYEVRLSSRHCQRLLRKLQFEPAPVVPSESG